jgi:hypothetical protein
MWERILLKCFFINPKDKSRFLKEAAFILRVEWTYGGKTLNHLKTYLSEFWDYYQTSPQLQKALEST